MSKKVVTFGEIMLRLSPPNFLRFAQAKTFDATYGGAEANVAITLANFGLPVEYVTRLPENELGDACLNYIRQFGVSTDNIVRGGERLGIYFLENGASHRSIKVIYDRSNSAFASIQPGDISWEKVFSDALWFHWTGITPAISKGAASVCLNAVKKAKEMGLTVSCDLNYRSKLWKWGKTAEEVMSKIVNFTDIIIGNEDAVDTIFGIGASESDSMKKEVEPENYRLIAEKLMKRFKNLKKVAITLRGNISASHNSWSAILYNEKKLYTAPVYQITHIVDRVGGGDAFTGGLIFGLLNFTTDLQLALDFAVAASCLKHTIRGDHNLVSITEVEKLARGRRSGHVISIT